ncbi:conserved hypothetical protein [sediment metagenome]|uniref:Uncharacterized protein n=1 Tax=sediment metagenome TaxID=749907 RepID=D9PGK0_9ZZZZ
MAYFSDAKVGDKVYGLIFGKGKIVDIFPDSYYSIMVEFKNGHEVPYTDDGIPGWGNFKKQTLFFRDDVDLCNEDFSPVDKPMSHKKIIKLREKKKLEVRCPSGVWTSAKKVDDEYLEKILKKEKYHLLRKKKEISKSKTKNKPKTEKIDKKKENK